MAILSKARQTLAAKVERLKDATARARAKVADQAGTDQIDIQRVPLSWWRERWRDKAIRRLFIENFIFVKDQFNKNKLVLLKFNDTQSHLFERLTRKDVILKKRKGGVSRLILALRFADALMLEGRNIRIVPHDPDTEAEFRRDLRVMYENLPPHLRVRTRQYTGEVIELVNGSIITTATVQPGHEEKGRGQALTDLHLTEIPFWRGDGKTAATALIEAAAEGNIVAESTPNGLEFFNSIYLQGKKGEAGWTSHCYQWWWQRHYRLEGARFVQARGAWLLLQPAQSLKDVWTVLPSGASEARRAAARAKFEKAKLTKEERVVALLILAHLKLLSYVPKRAKWNCSAVAEYLAWRRAKIEEIGEAKFKVEYLENDVDCFENTGRPVIPPKLLKITCEPSDPVEGHEYLLSCDPSLGKETGNPAGLQILDLNTGRQAYTEKVKMSPNHLAYHLGTLSDKYNGAQIVVESNSMGIAVINRLVDLGYDERLYRHLSKSLLRQIEDGKLSREEAWERADRGFPTTADVKPQLGIELEEAIRTEALGLSSELFCEEAQKVVWFDNGSFGALPGHEDDLFMAVAIGNYVAVKRYSQFSGFVGVMPEFGEAR